MATTVDHVCSLLDGRKIRYERYGSKRILISSRSKVYRNPKGESNLLMVIRVSEGGRYFKLYAPQAYALRDQDAGLFTLACSIIQWMTKLIQFEYNPSEAEVRPMIEFPLEDAELTDKQLIRCLRGMVAILDKYHPVLERVLTEGVIDFGATSSESANALTSLLSRVPPDVLADALRKADELRRSTNGHG